MKGGKDGCGALADVVLEAVGMLMKCHERVGEQELSHHRAGRVRGGGGLNSQSRKSSQ